jgi:hypothetical protein
MKRQKKDTSGKPGPRRRRGCAQNTQNIRDKDFCAVITAKEAGGIEDRIMTES